MSTMATESTLMSVRKAARRLGVHDNTVRRYADRGLIRAVRLPSGVRRLRREDVEALSASPEPVRSLDELLAPEILRSDEEAAAFLRLTYAERDRDR